MNNVTIPDSVLSIGYGAFISCYSFTQVIIPKTVTSIGDRPFAFCLSLGAITVDALNPNFASVDGVLFNKDQTRLIQCPGGKSGSYVLPNGVSSLGDSAFRGCINLTSVTIPNSLTNIGDYAFHYCTNLTAAYFAGNCPIPGKEVFIVANKVIVYYLPCATGWPPTFAGRPTALWDVHAADYAYYTNDDGTTMTIYGYFGPSGEVIIPSTIHGLPVTALSDSAFERRSDLTKITIPNGVTSIGHLAFLFCANLTSVILPNTVSSIGAYAFGDCFSLTKITIPNSVSIIRNGTFDSCFGLTSVTIPSGVNYISDEAFRGCTNLKGVFFQGNAPDIGFWLFSGAENATIYYLPGTTGWGQTFDDRPTALWNPIIQASDSTFGVRTNRFGFTIIGTPDIPFVVEATTGLSNPTWAPLQTNTLTGGSLYLSDSEWTNHPTRFYRLHSP